MELSSSAASGGGSGGAGPAPFLLKTYDMIDDPATDKIVSWSSNKSSFVVWNPPEFARILLPTYFKHNNFSSFIRQLNTYGFRKIDPEQWEFANEDFMKDKKHLLKNIHRRKPIHSHSQPQGSQPDPERVAFDEEIERLTLEKSAIQANILKFRQHNSAEKIQLENLAQRICGMEQKQRELIAFLEEEVANNPNYIQRLAQKIESMDLAAYSKRRRQLDSILPVSDIMDNNSISRPNFANMLHQDHSNKLNLELSSAASDINFVSRSTQSSNDDGGSSPRNISEGAPRDAAMRTECIVFTPETLELTDTGTSFTFNMESSLLRKIPAVECPGPNPIEEGDSHMSSLLNLTLASSALQENKIDRSTRIPEYYHEVGESQESRPEANGEEIPGFTSKSFASSSSRRSSTSKKEAPAPANDGFWEHFLTERPGVDTEEASSDFRRNPPDTQEEQNSTRGTSANIRSLNRLTL